MNATAETSGAPSPDAAEIMRSLSVLHGPNDVIEVRAPYKGSRKRIDAGCFDGLHREEAVAAIVKLNERGASPYIPLNVIDPQLLARHNNRIEEFAGATATDANVLRRQWLLVDLDPCRPKDTSATAEQLELVFKRAEAIFRFLVVECGWTKPVSADSGNGLHLLFRIDLPVDEHSLALVRNILAALAARFDDDKVKVDRSVCNAGRIVKPYGTVANKGDHTPAAPWRLSKLRVVPDPIETMPLESLQALAAEGAKKPKTKSTGNGYEQARAWTAADLQDFFTRGGIEATGPEQHEGALCWKLGCCPFNAEHGFGEAAVFLQQDGVLGFKCLHNSCADKHWADLRTLVDGDPDTRRNSNGSAHGRTDSGAESGAKPMSEPMAGLICAATINPEPIDWLWYLWLALAKLHILAGAPGTGKTTVALALAAILSSAGRWPDGTTARRGNVLIWSSEDDPKDTLVPRLIAMGADLSCIHFVETAQDGDRTRPFDPATDMAQLRATIKHLGISPDLLIVDPIVSAVAGDSHKGAETRRSLQPLVDLGAAERCALLGISHFSKGTAGRDVVERVTGSLAFGALARLVFAAAKMPDDQGGGRFIARAKSNLGPDGGGYGYEIQQHPLPNHPDISASTVVWGAVIEGNARDILAQAETAEDTDTKTQTTEAQDWLRDLLSNGPVLADLAGRKAKAAGISEKPLRTARERLGVKPFKKNFKGGWLWALPNAKEARPSQDAPEDAQGAQTLRPGNVGAFDGEGHLREPDAEVF
jgi:putative DNA primase/helicase